MCLKRFPKSLHICAFDFSCLTLSTAFFYCYFGADSNALSLVSFICRHDCDAMAIEYEIESKTII